MRINSQFVINEVCKVIAVAINPIVPFTAQDMYENMPNYDPQVPCLNQLPWPNVEPLLSINFLRQFTLRDKMEEVLVLADNMKHHILDLQKKHKCTDGYDFDIVFEITSPDCEEALLLEQLEPELEEMFGVSNIEISTPHQGSKHRPPTYVHKKVHTFVIKDYVTDAKTEYKLVAKLYRSVNPRLLKNGKNISK